MSNEQKNTLQALASENAAMRCDLMQVKPQIAALEGQVFVLESTLQRISEPSASGKSISDEGPQADALDPVALTRENVCLRAKLAYVSEAIAGMEETLLRLCDALER